MDIRKPGKLTELVAEGTLPAGFVFTKANQGSDDGKDSDVRATADAPLQWGIMDNTTLSAEFTVTEAIRADLGNVRITSELPAAPQALPWRLALTLALGLTACAGMTQQEKNTAIGAGVGAVSGSVLTGGGTLGTLGGAAIGGVIGNQIEDKK